MTDLVRLTLAEAAIRLRAAPGRGRDFLGLDPVTQNDALLARELRAMAATVFASGSTLLGLVQNVSNPRQATVATSTADAEALRRFLRFVGGHRRYGSFLAGVTADAVSLPALLDCGFREVGRLRQHVYRGGVYHDLRLYHAVLDTPES